MDEKKILKHAADTIVSKPVTLTIDIVKKTWLDKIKNRQSRVFAIHPLTLGSLVKISKELIEIDLGLFNKNNLLESNYQLIDKYGEKMARIISIAVVNQKNDPSKNLVQFFLDNLSAKELLQAASVVLQQMNISDFMHTIISIKGANVLPLKSASVTNAGKNEVSL
jgi:hypothetical protein